MRLEAFDKADGGQERLYRLLRTVEEEEAIAELFESAVLAKGSDAVIAEARRTHKKIFVTAGGSHAVTWEPAIEAMYRA